MRRINLLTACTRGETDGNSFHWHDVY